MQLVFFTLFDSFVIFFAEYLDGSLAGYVFGRIAVLHIWQALIQTHLRAITFDKLQLILVCHGLF